MAAWAQRGRPRRSAGERAGAARRPLGRDRRRPATRSISGPGLLRPHRRALGRAGGRAPPCCWSATVTSPGLARRARAALQEGGFRVISASVPPGEGSKTLAQVERLTRLAAEAGLRRPTPWWRSAAASWATWPASSPPPTSAASPGPRAHDAARDGQLGHRRQDRRRPARRARTTSARSGSPELVVMDTDLLATLPPRELACGFAEIVKYGPARRAASCSRGWMRGPRCPARAAELDELIRRCVDHKLARGGGATSATSGCPGGPQPGAHRGARHRGRRRLLATATARPSRWGCWPP